MSSFQILKNNDFASAASQDDGLNIVPSVVLPPRVGKPFQTSKKIRQVQAVSGSTAGPGQTSILKLQTGYGAGFLVPNSVYLTFQFYAVQAANTYGFKGSCPSAFSLINRLTLSQSAVIEQLQNYGIYLTNVLKPWCSSANSENISNITEGGIGQNNNLSLGYTSGLTTSALTTNPNTSFAFNATGNTTAGPFLTFTLPLVCGLFSGGTEGNYLPLELLGANIDIQIDWNTLNNAFYGVTSAVTGYGIQGLSLTYETVQLPDSYVSALRQQLASGKLWSIPVQTALSSQVAASSALSYNMSLNCSSVDAFFYGTIIAANQGTTLTSGNFTSSAGSTQALDSTQISRRMVYIDGNQVQQIPVLNADAVIIRETIRAVSSSVFDSNYTVPFSTAGAVGQPGSFRGQYYLIGFNLRSFSGSDMCMCGTPCSLLNLQINDSQAVGTDTIYMFAIVSFIVLIDGSGSISLIR